MLEPPLKPMLLSTKGMAFDSEDYIFEVKWDGYRCISFIDKSSIFLQSRNGNDLIRYFSELTEIYKAVDSKKAVLDGEICYIDNEGKANFSKLQGRIREKNSVSDRAIRLIVWDILSYDNNDIYQLPLLERKKILTQIVTEKDGIIVPGYIRTYGKKLFQEAEENKLEGIVAKKIGSPYEFKRSKYWYKIKCWQYFNAVIGGFSRDGPILLVGKYSNNLLDYMGKVKIALEKNMEEALFSYLPSIAIDTCPFSTKLPAANVKWVKPLIKTVIRYTELSKHNIFRHGYAIKIILDSSKEDES